MMRPRFVLVCYPAAMSTTGRFFGPFGKRCDSLDAVTAFLHLLPLTLVIGCVQPSIHNRVVDAGSSRSIEQTAPTWVEEFVSSENPVDGARPHVLLISLDTLRADHLGAWGYDRPTSPFLDELARFGVRFDRAFSHSPTTAPSHMSVFTGAFPSDHGAHIDYTTTPPTAYPVRRNLVTLPEIMKIPVIAPRPGLEVDRSPARPVLRGDLITSWKTSVSSAWRGCK